MKNKDACKACWTSPWAICNTTSMPSPHRCSMRRCRRTSRPWKTSTRSACNLKYPVKLPLSLIPGPVAFDSPRCWKRRCTISRRQKLPKTPGAAAQVSIARMSAAASRLRPRFPCPGLHRCAAASTLADSTSGISNPSCCRPQLKRDAPCRTSRWPVKKPLFRWRHWSPD
ncbi:hypothetical protein D3C76_392800 [compost metagenome]